MLETINWLALTVPFILAFSAYTALREKTVPQVAAAILAFAILAAVITGYYFMYPAIGFPLWMGWFA